MYPVNEQRQQMRAGMQCLAVSVCVQKGYRSLKRDSHPITSYVTENPLLTMGRKTRPDHEAS
jgi:hypothetical protein